MDQGSRATIDYLSSLPVGEVVLWAADNVAPEAPWATDWIDVRIPEGGPADMGWVWTILKPDDSDTGDPQQLWQFAWPIDIDVHDVWYPAECKYVYQLPVPAGEPLPRPLVAAFEEHARRVGGSYEARGGWSLGAVCDALPSWAVRNAGRKDLRFEWDRDAGPSPILTEVMERAAADAPVWDLGDGLRVVDRLMDELLALDPEEATRVTALLREAVRDFGGGRLSH